MNKTLTSTHVPQNSTIGRSPLIQTFFNPDSDEFFFNSSKDLHYYHHTPSVMVYTSTSLQPAPLASIHACAIVPFYSMDSDFYCKSLVKLQKISKMVYATSSNLFYIYMPIFVSIWNHLHKKQQIRLHKKNNKSGCIKTTNQVA